MQQSVTALDLAKQCRIPGCSSTNLTVHHIVPVELGGNDAANLVYLCRTHHALIERYYFWSRTRLAPSLCRELLKIARAFDTSAVPPLLVAELRGRTQRIWSELNGLPEARNPLWWQTVFAKALAWGQHQEIVRTVACSRAIIESPWFRDRRQQIGESHVVQVS